MGPGTKALAVLVGALVVACSPGHSAAQTVNPADALVDTGLALASGEGVAADPAKALESFQKAADLGDPRGQSNLGWSYLCGVGTPIDRLKGLRLLEKAAAQNDRLALYWLGAQASLGLPEGVTRDDTWATRATSKDARGEVVVGWYEPAAARGNARAQYLLGIATGAGLGGVPKDAARAVEWYRKAAEQGYAAAQNDLAEAYAKGEGVPKDAAKAREWYRKAAEQGYAAAKNSLRSAHISKGHSDAMKGAPEPAPDPDNAWEPPPD